MALQTVSASIRHLSYGLDVCRKSSTLKTMTANVSQYARPRLHITVPYWLNDPCAPVYDPHTGWYHLFYQCNPFSTEWANMSWGHVTSKDLLHWSFMPNQPALSPDQKYDKDGVFTGSMAPIGKDKKLHAFYSSICQLPFHWSTPPFPRNSAGLAMATSEDGGRSWKKSSQNPILKGEPEGILVSGYRDPYVAPWKELDQLRNSREQWYGLVSGGFDTKGPTSFIYAINPDTPERWHYIGPLIDLPMRWNPSIKWGGNFGINWECVNFVTLTSGFHNSTKSSRDFLLLGAEGETERSDIEKYSRPKGLPPRTIRTQVWMQGNLTKSASGEIQFVHNYSALFDHGPYYAANSFIDPKTSRRIVYGWIPEEDCSAKHAARKGWTGALALPREVYVQSISNVIRALWSPLEEITSIEVEPRPHSAAQGVTVHTLGIRPIAELKQLRERPLKVHNIASFHLNPTSQLTKHIATTATPTWELEATITVHNPSTKLGLHLRHSSTSTTRTTLLIDLPNEKVTLDRSHSIADPSLLPEINTCPDSGPFTLFYTHSHTHTQAQQPSSLNTTPSTLLEKLHIHIYSDGDTLEVFINERFAIATVVYTNNYTTCGGITAFVECEREPTHKSSGNDAVTFDKLQIWDGLNGGRSVISGWEHVGLKSTEDGTQSHL